MYKLVLFFISFLLSSQTYSHCSLTKIKAIESKLNDSQSIVFSFVENNAKTGKIYIKKPGMMKIDYYSPERVSIISKAGVVIYYDHQLDEMTKIKQDPNFLTFLSKDKIDFRKDFKNFNCEEKDDIINIKIAIDDKDNQEIILDLDFMQHNLSKISISSGKITSGKITKSVVFVEDLQYNLLLSVDRFSLRDKQFYDME